MIETEYIGKRKCITNLASMYHSWKKQYVSYSGYERLKGINANGFM